MGAARDLSDALSVPLPGAEGLRLRDARRLTGPNLYGDGTGAAAELYVTGMPPETVAAAWRSAWGRVAAAAALSAAGAVERPFAGGLGLYVPAAPDALYTAAFAIETAWHFAGSDLLGLPPGDFAAMTQALRAVARQEADPALLRLLAAAQAHGLDALWDDTALTLGHGASGVTYPAGDLPPPGAVDWAALANIPLVLVTGTNGKTTTTRLVAAMAAAAGLVSGLSSTEAVAVGGETVERGDFSGPAGARLLLRDRRVRAGALEVARGGILRRGLPVRRARAAVVTNVAADHLGEYGIATVADLARVKLTVRRGLGPGGTLVLNADDAGVAAEADRIGARAAWFSLDPGAARIAQARREGRPCAWLDGDRLILSAGAGTGTEAELLIRAGDAPLTMAGAARYNIENALAASLAAAAAGLPAQAIRATLASFRSDVADNPGRCNEFAWRGARVFVDFAHNPHSIAAVTAALRAIPARRRFVMLSHAGDRSDDDIRALAAGAFALGPDVVVAAENPGYLRGRSPGEVPRLLREASIAMGLPPSQVWTAARPAEAARRILDELGEGDLALLLVHADRAEIFAMLG